MGGPKLRAAGLDVRVDCTELSAMGTSEILGKMPRIWKALRVLESAAREEKPDAIVLLDFPDFHFRLARRISDLSAHKIYYIPPKVWVWRRGRLRFLRENFDRVLTILPFEAETYAGWGSQAAYVGNPLLDELPLNLTRQDARARLGMTLDRAWVALLPGSRSGELDRHLKLSMDALRIMAGELRKRGRIPEGERLSVRIPLPEGVRPEEWGLGDLYEEDVEFFFSRGDSALVLRAADLALVKSGTSTLEAALLGCPHVVFYRPSRLTAWIFEKFVRYRGPVGLSNLITWKGSEAPFPFREMLCDDARPELIARELLAIVDREDRRNEIRDVIDETRRVLLASGSPSARAAHAILEALRSPRIAGKNRDWSFASFCWSCVNAARRWIFENSGIPRKRYPCRVISVGNIEAGGTGKTPLVAWLAREAVSRGLRVWVLTRGYRSTSERAGAVIEPGQNAVDPTHFGDEAALIHQLVPDVWIGVGASRKRSYRALLRRTERPPDWLVLDDGFQQLGIEKDFEILALTSRGPKDAPYREFSSQSRLASLRVWTKGDVAPSSGYDARVRYRIELPLGWKKGDFVSVLSGLGDPKGFRSALEGLGLEIQAERALEDHAEFSDSLVQEVSEEARRRGWKIAVTGKDAVKLRDRPELRGVILGVFEPELEWVEGREKVMRLLWNS